MPVYTHSRTPQILGVICKYAENSKPNGSDYDSKIHKWTVACHKTVIIFYLLPRYTTLYLKNSIT